MYTFQILVTYNSYIAVFLCVRHTKDEGILQLCRLFITVKITLLGIRFKLI